MISPAPALLAVAGVAYAAQPGAVKPVEAPMRELEWGQLNFLHTTDTHGWLGGHFQEPQYSADWGDYISFTQHMRKKADDAGVDLLVVDTGDRIEGNGLYDASTPKGLFQYDIYAEQDVDIICTGNHELYQAYSVAKEHNTTVPNYRKQYIASNLDYLDPATGEQVPQAQRFKRFKTPNQGLDVLAMGFIFDFTGNANNSVVQKVEDAVKEEWFQEVIKERPDVFVVIGHVGLRMDEFRTIFTAMRKENWDTPILFFGGHAHVRDAVSYGDRSLAMASGRYMETIGWMSVDGLPKSKEDSEKEVGAEATLKLSRRYIDNNLFGLHHHSGLNATSFPTKHGEKVSSMITRARTALQLDAKLGCAPQSLYMSRAKYPSKDSIFSWITDELYPGILPKGNPKRKDKSAIGIMNTGGIRFDIFEGVFTRDSTYLISPFVSGFRYIPDVPWEVAKKVIAILNGGGPIFGATAQNGMPDLSMLGVAEQRHPTPGMATWMEEEEDQEEDSKQEPPQLELRSLLEDRNNDPPLLHGYTTHDDISSTGDDTIHKPLKFYPLPNAVQSKVNFPADGNPEKVDIVFIDFLQPWLIPALKFAGGGYENEDVKVYMDGTFTYRMAEWITENWKGEC